MNNRCTEDYAWVDELLEQKYYGYISEDEDNDERDYETFSNGEEERYAWVDDLLEKKYYSYVNVDDEKDDCETFSDDCETFSDDFDFLIRDLKTLIAYHEDRRQRRNKENDEVFALFNQMTANANI